jgi:hypothetical protein
LLIRDMYVLVVGALTRSMEIGEEALRRRSLLADAHVERSQEIKNKKPSTCWSSWCVFAKNHNCECPTPYECKIKNYT